MVKASSFIVKLLIAVISVYTLMVGGSSSGQISQVSLSFLTGCVLAWLFIRWRNRWQWTSSPLNLILAAGMVVVLIATVSNLDSWRRMTIGLWYWGLYLASWLLLIDCLANGLPARELITGFLLASLAVLVLGYWEFFFWLRAWLPVVNAGIPAPFAPPRPVSVAGNTNLLGTILILMIMLGLGRLVQFRRRFERVMLLLYIGLSGGLLYLTNSRGAMIGLALGLFVWLLLMMGQQGWLSLSFLRKTWGQLALTRQGLVIAGIIAAGLLCLLMIPVIWQSIFFRVELADITTGRMELWRIALTETLENPLTGTGPVTFGKDLLQHQYSLQPPPFHAHSLLLNVSAELGLPGVLVVFAWCVAVTVLWWKNLQQTRTQRQRYELIGLFGALVALAGHHLTDTLITTATIALISVVLIASAIADTLKVSHSKIYMRMGPILVSSLWILLLVTGWWSCSVKQDYEKAVAAIQIGDWRRGAELLENVIARDPGMPIYPAMQGYAYGLAAYYGDQAAIDDGLAAFENALQVENLYAPWWANLAALHWQAGHIDQALTTMEEALAHAPDYEFIQFNLGVMYEEAGEEQAAQEIYQNLLQQTAYKSLEYNLFWQETAVRQQALADYLDNLSFPAQSNQQETILNVLSLFEQGDYEAARDLLESHPNTAKKLSANRVLLSLAYELLDESEKADLWIQSAHLYSYRGPEQYNWVVVGDALLASWRVEPNAPELVAKARHLVDPAELGWDKDAGNTYASNQFSRFNFNEQYLPQLAYPSSPLEQQALELLLTFNL